MDQMPKADKTNHAVSVVDNQFRLPKADKTNHAVSVVDNQFLRTIWGPFLPGDIGVIREVYPEIPLDFIEKLTAIDGDHVELIPAARLLEVLIPIELVARYLRNEYSQIKRGIGDINIVANPLSILSFVDGVVKRVITPETELMHKPAEKLALRSGALEKVNMLLDRYFGLELAYGCSCCALVFKKEDREAVLASQYYKKREQQGRHWDSDVLAATGNLYGPVPIAEVPSVFLENSVDFGQEEVDSYLRFSQVAQRCIDEHENNVLNLNKWYNRAACFVGGQCQKHGEHCPLPPSVENPL